jgi:hypothetical protein
VLNWTGEVGYENDGLDPEQGSSCTPFVYRIEYTDADDDPPAVAKVWIDRDGDDVFDPTTEVFLMTPEGSTYSTGVIYTYTTPFPYTAGATNCKYFFEFSDSSTRYSLDTGNSVSALSPYSAINAPDILQTFSVEVSSAITNWNIGLVEPGTVWVSPMFEVSNLGSCQQTFSLQINQMGAGWTVTTESGTESYALKALFGDLSDPEPTGTDFGEEDLISARAAAASTTAFASNGLSANGLGVPSGEQRALWFQLAAPTETSQTGLQTIQITVGAQP